MTTLPEATARICTECPWRRDSTPGWLGPATADEWLEMAHGETPIACHMTVTNENWDDEGMRQCMGAATYRANICKLPRDPSVALAPSDHERVFSRRTEFTSHH